MAKMSGFAVTKLIRSSSSQRISQIPIIALTADYTIQDREKCISYGMNDYLLKPFSPEELLSKLINNLEGHKSSIIDQTITPFPKNQTVEQLVDLTRLFEDCGNDIEILEELVLLFKNNIIEFIEKGENQIVEKDAEGLGFSSHKIKAGLAMIEANDLSRTIFQIQNGCKEFPDWKHLNFLFACFVNNYKAVEQAIDKALSDMKDKEL